MNQKIIIKGMHCQSCEMLLEADIGKIKGVKIIALSYKTGVLEVEYEDEKNLEEIKEMIVKNHFTILEYPVSGGLQTEQILMYIAIILAICVGIYVLSFFNITNFLPDTQKLGYGGAFVIGLIASLSTCLALTGGIILGFTRYCDTQKTMQGHVKTQLLFHLGRGISFFLLGGVLGYIGKIFQINVGFTLLISCFVGIILIYMGLQTFGIVPSIAKWGMKMPTKYVKKMEEMAHPRYAFVVGALTFLVPCGFMQSVALLAMSSGSFISGGLLMLFFALGTFPVLFSVGLGAGYMNGKKSHFLKMVLGVLMLIFGIFVFANVFRLAPSSPQGQNTSEISSQNTGVFEEINIGHNGATLQPFSVHIKKGGNYKIIITPTSNGVGCMSTQVIPKLSSKVSYILAGVPIVYDMKDVQAGVYRVVCASMGMQQGEIVVE